MENSVVEFERRIFHAWLSVGRAFFILQNKEEETVTHNEYQAALLQLAQISELLTGMLSETGQDLFEKYCTIYEQVVLYENKTQKKA